MTDKASSAPESRTAGDPTKPQPTGGFYPPDGHPADPPKGPPVSVELPEPLSGTLTGTLTGTRIEATFQPDAPGGKGTPPGPKPATYNGKTLDQLSDAEVLQLAGTYGPSIISQELFDRAQQIQKTNPGGAFGPAILKPDYFPSQAPPTPSPAPASDTSGASGATGASGDDSWHPYSTKDLHKIAQQEGVSYKPRASREDLIQALEAANVLPPPISEFELSHGPRSG